MCRFSVGAEEQMSALEKKIEDLEGENGRLKARLEGKDGTDRTRRHGRGVR